LPKGLVGGAAQVTGQRPLSPRCFGCWRSLRSCARAGPSTREGKTREIFGGNKRRRSAGEEFSGRRPPTKEGLDGPERVRTIRQDSSQNVVDTKGPGTAEPCGAGTGPNSRPRQRTPKQVRALRACTITTGMACSKA
jgi:hypothetical protein